MCGIVGYIGNRPAQPILFGCLSRLEYRGYDSSGIAIRGSALRVVKDKIRISNLQTTSPSFPGKAGIGHTRWATHGIPSLNNAHPHLDCSGQIAVVHNGVITNYMRLKEQLISEGHVFHSETDTEVIPHLIEKYYHGDIVKAVETAIPYLEGSYAIAVLNEIEPRIIVARKDSPLVIGLGEGENMVASDVPAVLEYTKRIICLENGDVGVIAADNVRIRRDGMEIARPVQTINWNQTDMGKGEFEHFMLKEINEQPRVISNSLELPIPDETRLILDKDTEHILLLACGTSYHACLVGKYILEELFGARVTVELASEFNYCKHVTGATRAILITQSGETADVLNAMKRLNSCSVPTTVISNVAHSTACRTASHFICMNAGPEVSVAATKTFIAQLIILYRLALATHSIESSVREYLNDEMAALPAKVRRIIDDSAAIAECARYLSGYNNVFFIGRGINLPVALEGALKLKEISYIHAEGCAAGELKHGPLALMSKNTPVIAIVNHDRTYDAVMTNIKEIKARGAPVIMLTNSLADDDISDKVIRVDSVAPILSPVLNSVALQLLAYYTARVRGCPIDFPRNLAKSVTVE